MGKKKKEWTKTMHGKQLLSTGDIVRLMDGEDLLKCKVLACLAAEDGSCYASVEVIEGPRKGERIKSVMQSGMDQPPAE